MRRSRFIALVSMGTASLFLTACDDATETTVFNDVRQCIDSRVYSVEECQDNFAAARTAHAKAAPAYASKADCEADFGPGQCEPGAAALAAGATPAQTLAQLQPPAQPADAASASGGTGSIFMPMMMGYMMGSMLSGGRQAVAPQPLYRAREGAGAGPFRTAGGSYVADGPGKTKVGGAAAKAPAPRATTVARGGFGAMASATAGG